MVKNISLEKAVDILYNSYHKQYNAQKPWTIKSHGDIPLDKYTKSPDFYALVPVIYNEYPDREFLMCVDELIERILSAKDNLTKKEIYVLNLAIETRLRREQAEIDAGEDL